MIPLWLRRLFPPRRTVILEMTDGTLRVAKVTESASGWVAKVYYQYPTERIVVYLLQDGGEVIGKGNVTRWWPHQGWPDPGKPAGVEVDELA